MAFTVWTVRGSSVSWDAGVLSGDPAIVEVAEAFAEGSPPLPVTPTGPLVSGGLADARYALRAVLGACLSLGVRVASTEGAPSLPGGGDDPEATY